MTTFHGQELPRPPSNCDVCKSSNVHFTHIAELKWRQFGEWPYVYFCFDCKAAVGCHTGTRLPFGKMASSDIRKLRVEAHSKFDILWKSGKVARTDAYQKLATELNIKLTDCHIAQLSEQQLMFTIEWSKKFIYNEFILIERRKEKRKNANEKQSIRTRSKIAERKSKIGRR